MPFPRSEDVCLLDDIGGDIEHERSRSVKRGSSIMDTKLQERPEDGDGNGGEADETKCDGGTEQTENDVSDCNGGIGPDKLANVEAIEVTVAEDMTVIVTGDTEKKKHFFIVRWICTRPCIMFCKLNFVSVLYREVKNTFKRMISQSLLMIIH
jgi:hypothetical protein